jgi:hypothetical protein
MVKLIPASKSLLTVARMQKAAAVMQFKLEGQAIDRHPEWQMDQRRLLHRIDRREVGLDSGTPGIFPRSPRTVRLPTARQNLCGRVREVYRPERTKNSVRPDSCPRFVNL